MRLFTIIFFISINLCGNTQSILGKWKTIDDETGKPKSVILLFEKDGKIFGKIDALILEPHENQNPLCDKCEGDRFNEPIVGMEIIRDLELDDDTWEDGTICDPKSGSIYTCKLWLDEDNENVLHVRGYIAFFYRTQTWQRIK